MADFNTDLAGALTVTRIASTDRYRAHIAAGWQQGRGAFGGLVLGLLTRAMEEHAPDPTRPLRTLAGEIGAPVLVGEVELQVEVLRQGTGITSLHARLLQQGEVRAHASAIFARDRITDREFLGLQPPMLPPPEEVEVLPVGPPFGPEFGPAFEFRVTGPMPFSGSLELRSEGYIRAVSPPRTLRAAEVVALADAWWPTALSREEGPRPMATLTFGLQCALDPAELDPNQPLIHHARALFATDGYLTELRELWTLDGRLVALNPQTFAIIR
jgi:hypothetical protein